MGRKAKIPYEIKIKVASGIQSLPQVPPSKIFDK